MNTASVKQSLTDSIVDISSAIALVEANPKEALAKIGASTASLKAAGDQIEEALSASEEATTKQVAKSPVEQTFELIKSYFPSFDSEALVKAYTEEGVVGGLRYLLKVSDTDLVSPITYSTEGASDVLSFTIVNGAVADNADLVAKSIINLLSFVGRKVTFNTHDAIGNGHKFTFVIGKEAKNTAGGEFVVHSPILGILHTIFG